MINFLPIQKKLYLCNVFLKGKERKESAFAALFLNGESGQFAKRSGNKVK